MVIIMKYKGQDIKPVEKIELNEKNIKIRIVLIIISFCAIIASIIGIFIGLNKKDSGWSEIKAQPVSEYSCSDDFIFYYNLGHTNLSSKDEEKLIIAEYTKALEYSFKLLNKYKEYDDIKNLYYINNHPNQEIEIDSYLYTSLKNICSESNILYTSPIVDMYDAIFSASSDVEALKYCPDTNDNLKQIYQRLCLFIKDRNKIELRFLDNNKIFLFVSNDYAEFLKENEFSSYIDSSFLKNAIIIDYVTQELKKNNYTYGNIKTYDGYYINLNSEGNYPFEYPLVDKSLTSYTNIASIDFVGSISIVEYRSFMLYENDANRMRKIDDKVYSLYFDESDGINKYSKNMITFYSQNLSCLDIALKTYKQFINNEYNDIKYDNINYVYVENELINYTDSNIKFNMMKKGYEGAIIND